MVAAQPSFTMHYYSLLHMQSKAIGTWKRFAIFGKKSMTQRLSPEECTSRYCACCPASKDSFLTQFDDWPRSPTATAAWQSQCLQKPLRHYHTKKQNHLPAPGLGIKTVPSSKAMNQQCCSWVVQPILQSR